MPKEIIKSMARLSFGYNAEVVLPMENAVTILDNLSVAESIDSSDYHNHKIVPYKEEITLKLISEFEYKELKTKTLLEPPSEE